MADNQGWIRLHRQIMEMPEWLAEPFTKGQAWVDLLLLANHETGFIRKRGILIAVERGHVGYSEDALAARWQWSKGKVRRFLVELVRLSRIERRICEKTVLKNTSVSSLIYILNYDYYQSSGTEDGTEDGPKTVMEQRMKRMKRNTPFTPQEGDEAVPGKTDPSISPCPHKDIIEAYNATLGHLLPRVKLSLWPGSAGEKNLQMRWKEYESRQCLKFWTGLFDYIRECPLLTGDGNRGWKADLRWIVKKENLIKIQEGNYVRDR